MTILNQTEILISIFPEWAILLTIIGIFVAGALITCGTASETTALQIGGCVLFFIFMTAGYIGVIFKQGSGRYQYECLLDDTVPYTEIYDKYEVVEQRGSIWVLEDKEK